MSEQSNSMDKRPVADPSMAERGIDLVPESQQTKKPF